MKPSLFKIDEGRRDWAKANPVENGRGFNDGLSNQRHGVVSADGMCATVLVLMEEICVDGWKRPTADTSVQRRKVRLVGAEVGAVHSSDEAANPRGAKGPHLVGVNGEVRSAAMASFGEIATTKTTRWLQWTLCRRAKGMCSIAPAVNGLGERNAGNPPVTFHEGRGVVRGIFNE